MNAVERAARDALPTLADFCLVHVVHGKAIPCVAAAHVSRPGRTRVRALMRTHTIRRDDLVSSVAHVVRTERPLLLERVRLEPEPAIRRGETADLPSRLGVRSVLVVPIVDSGAVVGALSLCYSDSGRAYAARHLAPARRLAQRVARALGLGRRGKEPPGTAPAISTKGVKGWLSRGPAANRSSRATAKPSRPKTRPTP